MGRKRAADLDRARDGVGNERVSVVDDDHLDRRGRSGTEGEICDRSRGEADHNLVLDDRDLEVVPRGERRAGAGERVDDRDRARTRAELGRDELGGLTVVDRRDATARDRFDRFRQGGVIADRERDSLALECRIEIDGDQGGSAGGRDDIACAERERSPLRGGDRRNREERDREEREGAHARLPDGDDVRKHENLLWGGSPREAGCLGVCLIPRSKQI